jgi:DNA-binding Lrp family transcriptional regulator
MVLSYILITVNSNYESEVANELVKYEQVIDIHILFGQYDIIAKVKSDSEIALKTFILNKVRKIPNLTSTYTLIVADKNQ